MSNKVECLNRTKQIDEVCSIINNASSDSQGNSLAIYGEWGCGKTFFVHQVMEKYKDDFVFYYDCWANNYYEEPLIGLLDYLRKELNKRVRVARIGVEILKDGLKIISSFFDNLLENKIGFRPFKTIKGMRNYITNKRNDSLIDGGFNPYSDIDNAKTTIVEALRKLGEGNKKVLIFIDEVDRCDPRYSTKLLERVHHITSNCNATVILSVDKDQLEQSINVVYSFGKERNASAEYLRKVVNYSYDLGNGSFEKTQHEQIFGRLEDCFLACDGSAITNEDLLKFEAFIFENISIRKIERLVETTLVLHKTVFGEEKYSPLLLCGELLIGWGILAFGNKKEILSELSNQYDESHYNLFGYIQSNVRLIRGMQTIDGRPHLTIRNLPSYLFYIVKVLNRNFINFYFEYNEQNFLEANDLFENKYLPLLLKTNI